MIALLAAILGLILTVLCAVTVDLFQTVRADLRARRATRDNDDAGA